MAEQYSARAHEIFLTLDAFEDQTEGEPDAVRADYHIFKKRELAFYIAKHEPMAKVAEMMEAGVTVSFSRRANGDHDAVWHVSGAGVRSVVDSSFAEAVDAMHTLWKVWGDD